MNGQWAREKVYNNNKHDWHTCNAYTYTHGDMHINVLYILLINLIEGNRREEDSKCNKNFYSFSAVIYLNSATL